MELLEMEEQMTLSKSLTEQCCLVCNSARRSAAPDTLSRNLSMLRVTQRNFFALLKSVGSGWGAAGVVYTHASTNGRLGKRRRPGPAKTGSCMRFPCTASQLLF